MTCAANEIIVETANKFDRGFFFRQCFSQHGDKFKLFEAISADIKGKMIPDEYFTYAMDGQSIRKCKVGRLRSINQLKILARKSQIFTEMEGSFVLVEITSEP